MPRCKALQSLSLHAFNRIEYDYNNTSPNQSRIIKPQKDRKAIVVNSFTVAESRFLILFGSLFLFFSLFLKLTIDQFGISLAGVEFRDFTSCCVDYPFDQIDDVIANPFQ
jgi:hypothetical protein